MMSRCTIFWFMWYFKIQIYGIFLQKVNLEFSLWTVISGSIKSWSIPGSFCNGPFTRYAKLRVVHALGMLGAISPPPRSRHASRQVHDARAVMYAGIANYWFPLKSVAGKTLRHFRRMLNPQFCVSGKRPMLDNPPNSPHTHISRNLVHPPHPFRWLNRFAILHIALDYGEINHILCKRDLVRSELKVSDATPLSPSYFRIMILLLQSPLFCHATGLALSIFVKLWVVHAPGMPGKFSPPPT